MAYLNAQDAAIVTAAVTAAEQGTSGEIVTVMADRSDAYSDIALAWAAIASFTAMSVFAVWPAFFLGKIDWLMGGWGHDWTTGEIISLTVGFGLVKFLGVWLIQLWEPLKFLLIPGPVRPQYRGPLPI